jgi:hypothetical protein
MFTEVDPAEVDKATLSASFMDRNTFSADEEVNYTFAFTPQFGKYAQITIENTGKADAIVLVTRPHALGNADAEEYFSKVRVPAGQTLYRTFRIEESGMEPGNKLAVAITSVDEGAVQVRLSANEFTGSTQK